MQPAPSAGVTRGGTLEARILPQDFGFIGLFPRKLRFVTTKVSVGSSFLEDRTTQFQVIDDPARSQRKMFPD